MKLTWDKPGERLYETGVDHGVLYIPNSSGVYDNGVAWNGLTTVTESPSGAESNKVYADNIPYLNLISVEELGATVEAYTFPEEFAQFDGLAVPSAGLYVGQQSRKSFGLCYRTRVGNDLEGADLGYKLHLIYNATAAPSEKAFATINDSPEAITFSWELTTIPIPVDGTNPITGKEYKPTAQLTIDSTKVDPTKLAQLETLLYGDAGSDPQLPTPTEVIALFATGLTEVNMGVYANQPSYDAGTHVVTLPAVAGVQWRIDGADVASGAQPALEAGDIVEVTAVPADSSHVIVGDNDWTYDY
jgi:hypothetical protein